MNPQGVSGSVFQSNSDHSANSFTDPFNVAHLYPGWGANPNYQTPAYDAPYRPAYQGPNPYAAYGRPGFFSAANQLFNPLSFNPYWGDPITNNRAAINSLTSRPIDLSAEIGQRFIMPAVTIGVSQALFGNVSANVTGGFATGLASSLGASAGIAQKFGSAVGFAGRYAIPFGIGLGVSQAVDKAVFQPYLRSRQMGEIVGDSFAGITFGGGGNVISGRGLSATQASSIGSSIDYMGMKDLTFGANQYNAIASMGMRAGLFDDISGGNQITKRVKDIASQIKMILAISKDPNIQTAVEELAKLRLGGASISGGSASVAASAYSSIGLAASAAGASVQRVMSTVGGQGQYMFQMNGITPYLGQLAAANAFSGFASAQRSGLLSMAQIARMGGLEGATQSSLVAQLGASTTMYNQMGLMNQFFGQGKGNGVVNTVSNFGALAARNPLATAGHMGLYGNAMISQQMSGPDGVKSLENQAVSILQSMGVRAGPNGYDPGEVYQVMLGMGIPQESIQAYLSMRASQVSSGTRDQSMRAFRAQTKEQVMQVMDQEMLWGTPLGQFGGTVMRKYKGFRAGIADTFGHGPNRLWGQLSDAVESGWNELWNASSADFMRPEGIGDKEINFDNISPADERGMTGDVLRMINYAASKGGEGGSLAAQLMNLSPEDLKGDRGKKLFSEFLQSQTGSDMQEAYSSLRKSTKIFHSVTNAMLGNIRTKPKSSESEEELKIMDQAAEIHLSDGAYTLSLEKTLDDPRYKELKNNLANLGTTDEKIARINSLARGKIRSSRLRVRDDMTEEEVNAILRPSYNYDKAMAQQAQLSTSGVNYKSFIESTQSIERGAKVFNEAVNTFVNGNTKSLGPIDRWIEERRAQKKVR